jgi:tyrosyl-tRNA synthetase
MFRYYELLSDLAKTEIEELKQGLEQGALHPKEIKQKLARELTQRFHSADAALQAQQNFDNVFAKKDIPDDIAEYAIQADEAVWLPKLLVESGLVSSTSDGRRMIKQNAVSLDGEKVTDTDFSVEPQGSVIIKVGKRRFSKIVFT